MVGSCLHLPGSYDFRIAHFQTVVGAVVHALAALEADIDGTVAFLEDGIDRTGRNAVSTLNAEFFHKYDSASFALSHGAGGAGRHAGCGLAGQAALGGKT